VTQLHADIAWFISATSLALAIGLRFTAAPLRSRRYGWLMVGGVALQAVIGYTQYFLHLPAGLVWVHVTGSVLLWICALNLYLSTRERPPASAAAAPRRRPPPSTLSQCRTFREVLATVATEVISRGEGRQQVLIEPVQAGGGEAT